MGSNISLKEKENQTQSRHQQPPRRWTLRRIMTTTPASLAPIKIFHHHPKSQWYHLSPHLTSGLHYFLHAPRCLCATLHTHRDADQIKPLWDGGGAGRGRTYTTSSQLLSFSVGAGAHTLSIYPSRGKGKNCSCRPMVYSLLYAMQCNGKGDR